MPFMTRRSARRQDARAVRRRAVSSPHVRAARVGPRGDAPALLPNVPLTTHLGEPVRFYDLLKDRVVVLSMMYADCDGVCPRITSNLVKAQTILASRGIRGVFFYAITVKPEEDTPEKLRAYAEMHGAAANWRFLTGAPDVVEGLRRTLGYADINPEVDKDKTRHSGMIRIGNEPASIWSACQGSAKPEWIAEEISFVVPAPPNVR